MRVRIVVRLSMRLRILAYHAIADLSDDPVLAEYGVPPRLFAAQLDALIGAGWTSSTSTRCSPRLRRRGVCHGGRCCSASTTPTPTCSKSPPRSWPSAGCPEWSSPSPRSSGAPTSGTTRTGRRHSICSTPTGLRAVAAQGIEVGSHTISHRPLTKVPEVELEEEIAGSATRLEEAGLPRPPGLLYPYGDWSPSIAMVAHAAGYEASFTVEPGVVTGKSSPQAVPRIEVHASDTPSRLRRKLLSAGWPAPLGAPFLRLAGMRLPS